MWTERSGLEWTVDRLKGLKQSFKDRLQTGRYSIPIGWSTRKTRNGKVILADSFVHRVLSGPISSLDEIKKIEGFLRLYTILKLKEVSKRQRVKMEGAIEAPSSVSLDALMKEVKAKSLTQLRRLTRHDVVTVRAEEDNSMTLPEMIGKETKRSPVFGADHKGRLALMKSAPRNEARCAQWEDYFQCDEATNNFWKANPEFVARRLLGVENYPHILCLDGTTENAPAGTIGVIQDAGCKARWVANPILAFQALGEPLKGKLLKVCGIAYPEIGTENQDEGREAVVHWLQCGVKVWSFDATSFTDRFPLILQTDVLNQLREYGIASDSDVGAFDLVMSKDWVWHLRPKNLRWAVGQPLGYGPSFHLATLTHAAIIDNLDYEKTGMWRVVGDDVVIADVALACRYQEFMKLAGVEVNLSKSLISDKYAEFLGKLISDKGVTPAMKVRFLNGRDQLQDNLLFYGKSALEYLTLEELGMSSKVYLPEELGGLGWRVDSVPYDVWLSLTSQEDWSKRKLRKDLLGFTGPEKQTSAATEATMQSKVVYFDENVAPLSPQEWGQLGYGQDIDGITRIPTSAYAGHKASDTTFYHTAFADLVDKAISLSGDLSNLSPILNKDGYINHNEKPFNGQSCNYRSSTNVSEREQGDHPGRVFKFKVVKRLWKEATGETKRELERVLKTSRKPHAQTKRTERNSNG